MASLELHKMYRVLPDKEAQADGDLRVIDESGENYLSPLIFHLGDLRKPCRALTSLCSMKCKRPGFPPEMQGLDPQNQNPSLCKNTPQKKNFNKAPLRRFFKV